MLTAALKCQHLSEIVGVNRFMVGCVVIELVLVRSLEAFFKGNRF